ncbi:MAG: hypothetical protein U1E65_09800 [Myxococcota bacterium]
MHYPKVRIGYALLGLLAAGCASRSIFLEAPGEGVLMVVSRDSHGALVDVRTFLGPADGPQRTEVSPSAVELISVRLSLSALRAAAEDLDEARLAEISMLARTSCQLGLTADGHAREVSVPQTAELQRAVLSEGAAQFVPVSPGALGEAVLVLPVRGQRCPVPGSGTIAPFSTGFSAFGARTTLGNLNWIDSGNDSLDDAANLLHPLPLDEDHLLVHSHLMVAIVERGINYEGRVVPAAVSPGQLQTLGHQITNLAVWRRAGQPPLIWALGGVDGGTGFVQEIAVDGNVPRFVGTATIVSARLEAGAFDEVGTFLGVGGHNMVLGQPTSGFVIEIKAGARRTLEIPGDPLTILRLTNIPDKPHLVGTDGGGVYLGDMFGATQRGPADPNSMSTVRGFALTGQQLWASTEKSGYYRRALGETEFEALRFEVPAVYQACGNKVDSCGRQTQVTGRFGALELDESGAWLFSNTAGCTGALAIRVSDGCLAPIAEQGRAVELIGLGGWTGIATYQKHVYYVTARGRIGDLRLGD